MGKQNNLKDKAPAEFALVTADALQASPRMALASEPTGIELGAMQCGSVPAIALTKTGSLRSGAEFAEPQLPFPQSCDQAPANEKWDEGSALDQEAAADQSSTRSGMNDSDSAAPLAADENASAPAPENPPPRVSRFAMLAACLALAAALGGMVGALAAFSLARPQRAPVIAAGKFSSEEIHALKENVVQARVELAALKVSIDAGNRVATTQFTKLAERIERMERNAAEPAAKLNKAVENIERIARAENAAALKDVTGSIAPSKPPRTSPPDLKDGYCAMSIAARPTSKSQRHPGSGAGRPCAGAWPHRRHPQAGWPLGRCDIQRHD